METPLLWDAKIFLDTAANGTDIMSYFSHQPQPRLLKLLADYYLAKLDLKTAEKAFIMMSDYRGITFSIETILLEEEERQRAEVAIFLGGYDEAE